MSKITPLIVEIVGASGTGKSTLSGTLNRSDRRIRAGITVWGLPFSILFKGGFLSLPALFFLCVERRRFRGGEIKQIIRLNAFYIHLKNVVRNDGASSHTALFLDEGIVFALAKLHADSHDVEKNSGEFMSRWEQEVLNRWAKILDAIIWLDAPDQLLTERIRTRGKQHRMKNKPDGEVHEFLVRYRAAYERIIKELKRRSDRIEIINFRTDTDSPDRMTEKILQLVRTGGQHALLFSFIQNVFDL